jgi:NAD(P)-dependent dehydrogenase (short-subunit alcohol dehydrogenase family)
LHDATESLKATGVQVYGIQADLSTREGVEQLWSEVTALNRPIDIACINAGVGVGGLFSETDLDEELNMVNLIALAQCTSPSTWSGTWSPAIRAVSSSLHPSRAKWLHPARPSTPPPRLSIYLSRTEHSL